MLEVLVLMIQVPEAGLFSKLETWDSLARTPMMAAQKIHLVWKVKVVVLDVVTSCRFGEFGETLASVLVRAVEEGQ